jgi:hypothetical protein
MANSSLAPDESGVAGATLYFQMLGNGVEPVVASRFLLPLQTGGSPPRTFVRYSFG